jgi:hypothetical protein
MNQRRVLIGVGVAVVVLAAAAYGGTEWLRHRVVREIEATFAALRTPAGPATYGRAQFDPWTRTIRISDVARPADRKVTPPFKIGELVLAGVPLFPGERITVLRVELTGTEIAVDTAKTIRIDGVAIDDLDVSRTIDWQRLRALAEAGSGLPSAVPPPKDVLPVVAETLEGIRFARLEMRGLAVREGRGGVDIASVRLDGAVDGRLAEWTVQGVNSVALPEQVRFDRLALQKLDLAGLLRTAGQLNAANRAPNPDEIAALVNALAGIEMDEIVMPDRRPGRAPGGIIHIVSFRASWGQLVGLLPTTARYAVKAEMPIANEDGEPFQALREAGRKTLTVALDFSSTWTEQTHTFVLSPATFELDNLFSVSLALSLGNVPSGIFVDDPAKLAAAAAALEAGPIELSLHDSGGLDFVLAEAAKKQATSASAARARMVDQMKLAARMQPQQSPEFQQLVDALARFLAGDGSTLKVRLTPKGRVNVKQTLELANTDPIGALSQFAVEASVAAQ